MKWPRYQPPIPSTIPVSRLKLSSRRLVETGTADLGLLAYPEGAESRPALEYEVAYELEFLPLRRNLSWATLKTYSRRWRELVLYAEVAARMAFGQKPIDIEQRLLIDAAARTSPGSMSVPAE